MLLKLLHPSVGTTDWLIWRMPVALVLGVAGSMKVRALASGKVANDELLWRLTGGQWQLYLAFAVAEILFATWVLTARNPVKVGRALMCIAGLFLGTIIADHVFGKGSGCGCFGSTTLGLSKRTMSAITIGLDVAIAISGAVLARGGSPTTGVPGPPAPREADSAGLAANTALANRRGFSLVELMVVIGVIAIFIGLTIPAVLLVRQKARATACASNIRQTASALILYSQENRDLIPRGVSPYGSDQPIWMVAVGDMLLRKKAWSWDDLRKLEVSRCPDHPERKFASSHYLMNAFSFEPKAGEAWPRSPATRWSRVVGTAAGGSTRVPMLVEATDELGPGMMIFDDLGFESELLVFDPKHLPGSASGVRIAATRHKSGSNVAYFDGHVDLVGPKNWALSQMDDGIRGRFR